MTLLRRRAALMDAGDNTDWKSLYCGLIDGSYTGEAVIPSDVTSLAPCAFAGSGISSAEVNFSSIPTLCFKLCSNLTHITFGNSVTNIEMYVGDDCRALERLDIGTGITSIANYTFRNSSNTLIVTVAATTPPIIRGTSFPNAAAIYVPDDYVNTYKTTGEWANRASIIHPISELPT